MSNALFSGSRVALAAAALLAALSTDARAQWVSHPTPGLPRTATGAGDLSAPIPRTPDGRPDLSGIWQADPDPDGRPGGVENGIAPRHFISVTSRNPAEVPFQPWAREVALTRLARNGKDDPSSNCEPIGVPRYDSFPSPYKIIQLSGLTIVLHEYDTTFRQIFTDGRSFPVDPQPSWMGYSVGRWEGDTLVVETVGFNDRSWLDVMGHAHSEAMRVVERFTRLDLGHMRIDVTIDDPKTYTRPLTFTQEQHLLPDTELIESFCVENEKDRSHLVDK
jgi:hypothetical protein